MEYEQCRLNKLVRQDSARSAQTRQDEGVLVIAAPGQGAQTPGFLSAWLELPSFAERFAWLCAVSDLDLAHFGTQADAETIRDTSIAQPLLVASAIAISHELFPSGRLGDSGRVMTTGHSVGEIAAAALAGAISSESAMVFVRERGRAMAEASAVVPTGMSAVIAGKEDEVIAAITAAGLTPANYNGSGQIVAAGTLEQLKSFADNPPARCRIIPLKVAGAFHTVHMTSAKEHLRLLANSVTTSDARIGLISNRDGEVVTSGKEYMDRIVSQITSPVRWDLCLQTMAAEGVTGFLELAPAGTLTGIVKRNLKGVEVFNLNTYDQLDEATRFCALHSTAKRES